MALCCNGFGIIYIYVRYYSRIKCSNQKKKWTNEKKKKIDYGQAIYKSEPEHCALYAIQHISLFIYPIETAFLN